MTIRESSSPYGSNPTGEPGAADDWAEELPVQGRTSILLCPKAILLTSSQMERLRRSEMALMASFSIIKLSNPAELAGLFSYGDAPGECSAREAFRLLRSLTRNRVT